MSHLLVRSTPPTAQPQGQPPTPSLASPHSPLAPFQSQLHPAATGNLKKQDGSHCSAEAFAGNPSTFTERPNSTAEPESGPHVCLVVLRPSCFYSVSRALTAGTHVHFHQCPGGMTSWSISPWNLELPVLLTLSPLTRSISLSSQ